jgi:hypothetical protein
MVAPSFCTLVLYVLIVPEKKKGRILMKTGGGERTETGTMKEGASNDLH